VILKEIFRDGAGRIDLAVPTVRLFSDHSGIGLKLRGYAIDGEHGRSFAVLLEEIEPAGLFQQRMIYRYGLSPREAQVLALRRGAFTSGQIAARLELSIATVKTYLRQVSVKLNHDHPQ
jgi:DNA-binding CsgD family transcriptional regulator